jgi:hypothetical protein
MTVLSEGRFGACASDVARLMVGVIGVAGLPAGIDAGESSCTY